MKKHISSFNRRVGDSGFSLVELLVAVIVLGIIVGPLLHTFVTGSVTAAKSSKMGDATLAAQNISETVEAGNFTDLVGSASPMGQATVTSTGTGYKVTLDSVTAGRSTFAAEVAFEPQKTAWFTAINAQQMTDYSKMDAVYAQPSDAVDDPDKLAVQDFNTFKPLTITGTPTVSRVILLNVTSADQKTMTAELSYNYTFSYTTQEVGADGQPTTRPGTRTFAKTFQMFPQGFDISGGVYPSIYVLYNPWYQDSGAVSGIRRVQSTADVNNSVDTVRVINNKDQGTALPFKLFLVKQHTAEFSSSNETSYNAMIVLAQPASRTATTSAKVFSNAGENLSTGGKITTVMFREQIGNYQYGQKDFAGETPGDLVSKRARNRIYDVNITIKDGAKTVYTLTTTKLS